MRVSDSYLFDKSQYYINLAYTKISQLQDKISTGKRVSVVSDDVSSYIQISNIKFLKDQYSIYKKNIDFLDTKISLAGSSISGVKEILYKVKKLTAEGISETSTNQTRQVIVKQLQQLLKQAVDLANSKYGNDYIFSADKNLDKPFKVIGDPPSQVIYQGGNSLVKKQISDNIYLQENFSGDNVFNGGYNKYLSVFNAIFNIIDLFKTNNLKSLSSLNNTGQIVNPANSLATESANGNLAIKPSTNGVFNINGVDIAWNNSQSINSIIANINANVSGVNAYYDNINQKIVIEPNDKDRLVYIYDKEGNFTDFTYLINSVKQISDIIDYMSLQEAKVGNLQNNLKEVKSKNEEFVQNLVDNLSDLQDLDYAKAISDLSMQEIVYKSALSVASKIASNNLFDYIR